MDFVFAIAVGGCLIAGALAVRKSRDPFASFLRAGCLAFVTISIIGAVLVAFCLPHPSRDDLLKPATTVIQDPLKRLAKSISGSPSVTSKRLNS